MGSAGGEFVAFLRICISPVGNRPSNSREAAPRGEALKMEAVLRELGYRRAVLDAVPPTKNAQLLYEAMGFLRDTSLFCESNAGYPVLCI